MTLTEQSIIEALRPIQDPDLHRSIVDLDFIKNVQIAGGKVTFDLVLTTPACPVRDKFKQDCERAVGALDGVDFVEVTLKAETRRAPLAGRKVLESVANIVAVASGKGGVAKSTTAVNLALALSATGARVGLLDADIYGPSLPTMLQVEQEPKVLQDNVLEPAISQGIKLISIGFFMPPGRAAILRGPMISGYVTQFLTNVQWGALDYLIVDYPPGTGDVQLTLSQQAAVTGAVLCTTPQEVALIDVQKAVAMFQATNVPVLGIVETMSYFVCDSCDKKHQLFGEGGGERLAQQAGVPLLGCIPFDPRVVRSGDAGRPIVGLHPESPAARAYSEVAGTLAAELSKRNLSQQGGLEEFSLAWNG